MYHGSVKLSELEEEIGKEKLNEFIANIQDAFGEKEKVYFNFLSYDRFEDRYTDPAIEKKGNYLQNVLLYEVLGKEKYKKIAEKYGGKKMCITLYRVNRSWDYVELKKNFTQKKSNEKIVEELDLKKTNYIRKLKERSRCVTKDSL